MRGSISQFRWCLWLLFCVSLWCLLTDPAFAQIASDSASSSVTLIIPVLDDPAWLPVWYRALYVALKGATVALIGHFMWRLV